MSTGRRATRREFLTAGAGGIAGAALVAACPGSRHSDANPPQGGTLTVRTLGRTGLTLPVVSMGSAYEPGLVRAALDAGIT